MGFKVVLICLKIGKDSFFIGNEVIKITSDSVVGL